MTPVMASDIVEIKVYCIVKVNLVVYQKINAYTTCLVGVHGVVMFSMEMYLTVQGNLSDFSWQFIWLSILIYLTVNGNFTDYPW